MSSRNKQNFNPRFMRLLFIDNSFFRAGVSVLLVFIIYTQVVIDFY